MIIWAFDLKKGMELGPWTSCIDRLATKTRGSRGSARRRRRHPRGPRVALLAEKRQRVCEPTPDTPALVIIINEYADDPSTNSERSTPTLACWSLAAPGHVERLVSSETEVQRLMVGVGYRLGARTDRADAQHRTLSGEGPG